jgi:hypothetical protein
MNTNQQQLEDLYMNQLFLTPTIEKQATYHVIGRDQTQWVKDIVTKFLEEYPFLQNSPLTVTWTKKDATKGYAVGALHVLGGQVPLIIKEGALAPMDVIMFPGNLTVPLSESILKELMAEPTPFKGVAMAKGKSNLSLWGETSGLQWSPTDVDTDTVNTEESSSTRDAVKVSSFIDNIGRIDKEAAKEILLEVRDNPELHEGFKKNGTLSVLEKLAKAVDAVDEVDSFVRGLEIDRQCVFSDTLGNYHVKMANSAVDHVWEVEVAPNEIETIDEKLAACTSSVKNSSKSAKKANAYKILDKKAYLYVDSDKNWGILDENLVKNSIENVKIAATTPQIGDIGVWKINDVVTAPFEIVAISKNAEFERGNLYKLANRAGSLYINEQKEWAVSDKSIDKTATVTEFDGVEPKVGDTGCWVIDDVATVPFEIVGMQKLSAVGGWKIDTFDGFNKVSYYPIRPKSTSVIAHDTEKSAFYVPGNAKFVKLDEKLAKTAEFTRLSNANESGILEIVALQDLDKISFFITRQKDGNFEKNSTYIPENADFIKLSSKIEISRDLLDTSVSTAVVTKDMSGLYNISGVEAEKYAERHEIRNLGLNDVKWSLAHLGATSYDLQKISALKNGEQVKIASKLVCPRDPKAIIEVIKADYAASSVKIAALTRNLVKEAAVLNDETTVDAVLSLGLLRKNNVAEYIALIPNYEMIMSELAKLLVSTRLGMTQLPEDVIKNAMEGVTSVVEILRGIRASLMKN